MQINDTLILPPLELELERTSCCRVRLSLRPESVETIIDIREVQVSPRRKCRGFVLKNGEVVLIVDRKLPDVPSAVDGVLIEGKSGVFRWAYHTQLQEAAKVWSTDAVSFRDRTHRTWDDTFALKIRARAGTDSLRPPQLGALHAVGAHWSLHTNPATVVMPTGTGKTETMIASIVGFVRGPSLVVVPSRQLRDQTVDKFLNLGLLRLLGVVSPHAMNPVVGVLEHRPRTAEDVAVLARCDVVIAVVNTVAQGTAVDVGPDLASVFECLIIDEAHHIAAQSWNELRRNFFGRRVLQFTATPFRRDGKPVEGKIIYNYPLGRAQEDGYFKPIRFHSILQSDLDTGDRLLATSAIAQLRDDLKAGLDHILMARCSSIERARAIHSIYLKAAADLNPVLVHSEDRQSRVALVDLRSRISRVVVCVDMLGEGFDLPQLKVAAIHDTHKSLGVVLQFTGRFTRAARNIGDASVFANIADQNVTSALERLYSEDADWNKLLSEFSSQAIQDQVRLLDFLAGMTRLDEPGDDATVVLTPKALRPKLSTLVYACNEFHPHRFIDGVDGEHLVGVWLNEAERVLALVTRIEPRVEWTNVRAVKDVQWDLTVVFYDQAERLLFISSSDRDSTYAELAKAVGGNTTEQLHGDVMFRCLGRISRLVFQNVGLKKHGRRNLRFSMYSGADVAQALTPTQRSTSTKSNVFGSGYEAGAPIAVGCSYKGRVWARGQESIPEFMRWARAVGSKLNDSSIGTEDVIDHVLVPKEIETFPAQQILCLDWPHELLERPEERVHIVMRDGSEEALSSFSIESLAVTADQKAMSFRVTNGVDSTVYKFELGLGLRFGFDISHSEGERLSIRLGSKTIDLAEWFCDCPPNVLFVDGSELEGNAHVEPKDWSLKPVPSERVHAWDWTDVDLQVESMWRGGVKRSRSIQEKAFDEVSRSRFDVIMDDDGAGEAADLVCIAEEPDHIRLILIHCKYSGGLEAGERVKDVVEVCSQAVRSSRWAWRFDNLVRHLLSREANRIKNAQVSRFLRGGAQNLRNLIRISRYKEVRTEIWIVQPGLSKSKPSEAQGTILSAAHSFLLETVQVGLTVVCGA